MTDRQNKWIHFLKWQFIRTAREVIRIQNILEYTSRRKIKIIGYATGVKRLVQFFWWGTCRLLGWLTSKYWTELKEVPLNRNQALMHLQSHVSVYYYYGNGGSCFISDYAVYSFAFSNWNIFYEKNLFFLFDCFYPLKS